MRMALCPGLDHGHGARLRRAGRTTSRDGLDRAVDENEAKSAWPVPSVRPPCTTVTLGAPLAGIMSGRADQVGILLQRVTERTMRPMTDE